MNSPSGKPFDPINLSEYASQRTRERSTDQGDSVDHQDDPALSPYMPKRAAGTTRSERTSVLIASAPLPTFQQAAVKLEPEDPELRSIENSIKVFLREGPPDGSAAIGDDGPSSGEPAHESAYGNGGRSDGGIDTGPYPSRSSSIVDAQLTGSQHRKQHRAAEQRAEAQRAPDAKSVDDDLRRLESSLQWLRREKAAQAPYTRPDPAPGAFGETSLRRARNTAEATAHHAPPSLEPERMPPPPVTPLNIDILRRPLVGVAAGIVIALPLIYFTFSPSTPEPARSVQLASVDGASLQLVRSPPLPTPARQSPAVEVPPIRAADPVAEPFENFAALPPPIEQPLQSSIVAKRSAPSEPEPAPAARPSPPEPAAEPAPVEAKPNPPTKTLDRDMITLLIKQGEQLIASGDLITARVVFQRAAESGDATATMALGATYDPSVIARLGVRGIAPDVEKARYWYQKAKDLGSSEAPRRLELLANR